METEAVTPPRSIVITMPVARYADFT